jgi:hypothetical protein
LVFVGADSGREKAHFNVINRIRVSLPRLLQSWHGPC